VIYGLGTDIVAVARLEKIWQRHGQRFFSHLLAESEMQDIPETGVPRFLAKRFAAKEAFAKAAGTGLRAPITLTAVTVEHDELGKPQLVFAPDVQQWLKERGIGSWHVSISDEREMVVAVVILEQCS